MKKIKLNQFLEFLSLILILSYFFIHNILLVLIGITFSFYLMNINFISSYMKTINKKLVVEKKSRELHNKDKVKNSNSFNIKTCKEDPKISLVETIEEIGFIPSLDKKVSS